MPRITKVYTRTGDDGSTALGGGQRLPKDALRIACYGTVDELNSSIGVFIAELDQDEELAATFRDVQNDLFDIGGELSMPGHAIVKDSAWQALESAIEALNEPLEALTNFILPGGSRVVALCHVCRAVARRAERCYVKLCDEVGEEADQVNDASRIYLNRLSDLCFVAARFIAHQRGEEEVLWQQNTRP